ncbi:hypothetical protein AC579_2588 [Pseudocercospora musae]|uniref:Uncharacterized protein n=1 Tax=Pseudocercospora musae TaxID=113226 RepID=A0A139IF52_9PEZI|nr:hypothetical protein AC579_2588 [Pseudocercospora musae]
MADQHHFFATLPVRPPRSQQIPPPPPPGARATTTAAVAAADTGPLPSLGGSVGNIPTVLGQGSGTPFSPPPLPPAPPGLGAVANNFGPGQPFNFDSTLAATTSALTRVEVDENREMTAEEAWVSESLETDLASLEWEMGEEKKFGWEKMVGVEKSVNPPPASFGYDAEGYAARCGGRSQKEERKEELRGMTRRERAEATSSVILDSTVSVVGGPTSVVSSSGSVAKSMIAPDSFIQQAEKFSSTSGVVAMAGMKVDDDFFVHIADDGVVRSWAANGTVIDAIRLTNRQLLEQIANAPLQLKPYVHHLEKVYANVDGHDVPEDELYHPTRMNTPTKFGGPTVNERIDLKLDAEAKKIWEELNITTAEETVEAFKTAQSANPADVLRRQAQNPRQCLGRICARTSSCRFLGCAVCMDWDIILISTMTCAGPIIPPTVDGSP